MTNISLKNKKKKKSVGVKSIVGRQERVNLPELKLVDAIAKIDTGAFTSSLHCTNISTEIFKNNQIVLFSVYDAINQEEQFISCPVHAERLVKSSNGQKEKRYVISTTLEMGGKIFETEFTLSDRSEMKHPILIGRKALDGRFLVDVSKTNKRSAN